MSVQHVKEAITAFLASPKPEVLCVRGRWGTGKTFNWKTIARAQRGTAGGIALNNYAYVSLFGVNSITDLKSQILQNTVTRAQIGDVPSMETAGKIVSTVETATKKGFLGTLSGILGSRSETVVSALGLLISKQIICVDDLERKGDKISSSDVLGYISHLKEERGCKIVILLNDEALKGSDKQQFSSYLEKVVDKNLLFAPTAAETADIAITAGGATAEFVRERCNTLGIDNIRVIRKIYALVCDIEPLLANFEPAVFRDVASSIVLLGWCHLQPEIAPSWEYLDEKRSYWSNVTPEDEASDADNAWSKLLDHYGYRYTSPFDVLLMRGVRAGYFEAEIVNSHAAELHNHAVINAAQEELIKAWKFYHYSFEADEDAICAAFIECFTHSAAYHSLSALISVFNLLCALDRRKDAEVVFALYVEAKQGIKVAFDIEEAHVREEIDPELAKMIEAQHAAINPLLSFQEAMLQLDRGYHADINIVLAAGSVDDFYNALKAATDTQRSDMMHGFRDLARIANPSDEVIALLDKAGLALKRIASESKLNAHRVKGWGLVERLEREALRGRPVFLLSETEDSTKTPKSAQPDTPPKRGRRSPKQPQ